MDNLGNTLNKKTDLVKFCKATWTDEQLLQVLLVVDSWTSDVLKKSFITQFATLDTFRNDIIATPALVSAWSFYQTTDIVRLRFVNTLRVDYPNILTKWITFADDLIRNRFITDFNGNTGSLAQLNSDITLVDSWLTVRHLTAQENSILFLGWLKRINGSESQFVRLRKHIFVGDPTYVGTTTTINRVKGVHHQTAITYTGSGTPMPGHIRLTDVPTSVGANGVYEQKVEIFNGTAWNPKIGPGNKATFFPNSWTKERVLEEIAWARARITVANWVPPVPAAPSAPPNMSNTYRIAMTTGDLIDFYIGNMLSMAPTTLTDNLFSSFPKR